VKDGGLPHGEGKKFLRIRADLVARIRSGEWAAGALLPTREALAKEYGTTKATLEKAISRLIAEGTLGAVRKKGTFVGEQNPPASVALVAPPSAGSNLEAPQGDSVFLSASEGFWKNPGRLKPRLLPWPVFMADPTGWEAAVFLYPEEAELKAARALHQDSGLRIFAINRMPDGIDYVSYDHRRACQEALLRYGKILARPFLPVFLEVKNPSLPVVYRREGFLAACASLGLYYRVLTLDSWDHAGQALEAVEAPHPLAVVSASGHASPSVASLVRRRGLTPGSDFWYTGFDDEDPAGRLGIAFSTFRQVPVVLGELAAAMLADLIDGKIKSAHEALPVPFVEGVS